MTSRQEIRERRKKLRQKQRTTTVLIILGIVLIFFAVLMIPIISDAITPVGDFIVPEPNPRPMEVANAVGNPNAPVLFEIYSDFGCGHCGNFAQTTGEMIIDNYVANGQVYMVYNSVGSIMRHPASMATIEAAYCAGEQNKFWEYHDILFANQAMLFANINQKPDKILIAFADSLKMDTAMFSDCLDSNRYDDQIQQDAIDATAAGINSTPSFLINGEMIVGHQPYSEFQVAIESALSKAQRLFP